MKREIRESFPQELPESVIQSDNDRTFSPKLKNDPEQTSLSTLI